MADVDFQKKSERLSDGAAFAQFRNGKRKDNSISLRNVEVSLHVVYIIYGKLTSLRNVEVRATRAVKSDIGIESESDGPAIR